MHHNIANFTTKLHKYSIQLQYNGQCQDDFPAQNQSKMVINQSQNDIKLLSNSLFSFYTTQLIQLLKYNGQCQDDFPAQNQSKMVINQSQNDITLLSNSLFSFYTTQLIQLLKYSLFSFKLQWSTPREHEQFQNDIKLSSEQLIQLLYNTACSAFKLQWSVPRGLCC